MQWKNIFIDGELHFAYHVRLLKGRRFDAVALNYLLEIHLKTLKPELEKENSFYLFQKATA